MKKACNVLDYDFYSFDYPLRQVGFAKDKRNQFICSELEKRHPCFSDDCCFDYKLRLNKKKLKADVVVMQKFRLAEYKSQGKKIYIPEGKMTAFNSHIKLWAFVVSVFLLLILCVFAGIRGRKSVNDNLSTAAVAVTEQNSTEEIQIQTFELVELAKTLGGTVDSFFWETDGFTEKITLSTQRIYPEQILPVFPQAKFSSLTFDSFVPRLTVQLTTRVNNGICADQNFHLTEFMSGFRSFLSQEIKGAFIMEETVKPHSIKFSLRQDLKSGTEKVLGILDEEKICVSSLVLKKQADEILFEIVFSDVQFNNQEKLLQTLLENVNLFFEEQETFSQSVETQAQTQTQTRSYMESSVQEENLTLVGKIMHGGERMTEYYKTPEGKIIKKER